MNNFPISTILRALLKWWWLIVVSTALGVAVGYFVGSGQPEIYSAKATVLVGQDPRFSGANINTGRNPLLEAYSVFAQRPSVLQPVIDELGLQVEPDTLAGFIELRPNEGASLLEIVFYDIEPERAALIANRIALELVRQSLRSNTAQNLEFIQEQLVNLENQINNLQADLDDLNAEAAGITSAFALSQNRAERTQIDTLISELRAQYAQLNSGLTNVQGQVSLFEEALPNYWPVASSSALELILAGAAGLVLSLFTVVLITFFDDRLQWQESNFETILGQRVLGPLGIIPNNKLPLYAQTMIGSIEVEALRQIRDKIFLTGDNRPQVITFVSYDSGDGKTITTSNIAATFANSGLRTIILDLDLRKGDLHEVFRLPNMVGISDLLAVADPLEEIIHEAILDTGIERLSVMTAGRSNADPSGLLSKSRFPQLIYLLRQQYDVVVMDSVPTIAGSDPVFLAEVSDGVVIVVSARRTTQTMLNRTLASLREAQNINILGVVFNRVRLQITSKYSSPYYHPSTTLRRAQQLNQEFLKPVQGTPLTLRARIITGRGGERLYSYRAAAIRLGVRERTVRKWTSTGYLKAKRHYLRYYISEDEINGLLKRLPVQQEAHQKTTVQQPIPMAEQFAEPISTTATSDLSRLPDQLREQRAALLNYVNQPAQNDHDSQNSNSHE